MAASSERSPIAGNGDNSTNNNNNNISPKLDEDVSAWQHGSFSDWTIKVIKSSEDESDTTFVDGGDSISNDNDGGGNDNDKYYQNSVEKDKNETTTYRVHRVYLASGPRRSEYFQTLFNLMLSSSCRTDDENENDDNENVTEKIITEEISSRMTKLVLPESACRAFPRFLDYIYDGVFGFDRRGDAENNTTNDNVTALNPRFLFQNNNNDNDNSENEMQQYKLLQEAVALTFLADYLRVPKLIPKTKLLVRSLLNDSNIHVVCQEASLYGIEWIIEDCINIASQSPRDLLPMEETSLSSSIASSDHPSPPQLLFSSPAKQTMELLSPERRIQLLQLSLSHSLKELGQFKRVPSRWKDNIDDVVATHMPTLMMNNTISDDHHQRHDHHRMGTYLLPTQGCGLPFPEDKICPLFYFDREPSPRTLSSSPLPLPSQPRHLSAITPIGCIS
jgi:hypothetical protein